MNKLSTMRLLALVAALALMLTAAACGDDDEDESGGSAGTTTQEETMAEGQELTLNGENTVLTLDEATAGVLQENKVEVAPVNPAAPDDPTSIQFPITGGAVNSETLAGSIEHSGGLRFSAGGTRLAVTDFVADTETSTLTATAGGAEIPLLTLDLSGLERSMEGGAIVASGIGATLTADAATALNDTFKVKFFEEGLSMGTLTVTATAAS